MEMNKETVDAIIENSFEKQAEELLGSVPETKVELAEEEQANFEEAEKPQVEFLTKEEIIEKYPLTEKEVFSKPTVSPDMVIAINTQTGETKTLKEVKEMINYSPTSPQPDQEQSRHDEVNEPANKPLIDPEKIRERIDSLQKSEATQEELDTMILSERANAMIEYIQNRTTGEKRQDRMKQATIAITMILKAKTEALNAMRQGRI